jgi:hypothetical protein
VVDVHHCVGAGEVRYLDAGDGLQASDCWRREKNTDAAESAVGRPSGSTWYKSTTYARVPEEYKSPEVQWYSQLQHHPKKYYAVLRGFQPGIYTTWDECRREVEQFSGARYKSFRSREETEAFLGK